MPGHKKLNSDIPRRAVRYLVLSLTLMSTASVVVAVPADITTQEMALISQYCRYTQTFKNESGHSESSLKPSPAAQRWVAVMGPTFWHMHHYCWGQISVLRANRSNSSTGGISRTSLLESAVADYNYVIRNAPRDFVLLPEILSRLGEVEVRLGRIADANKSFAEARALKPDYWPAWSHWAEFLIKAGKRTEALEFVKSGLQHNPRSKVLREQYRLLGGNPSATAPRAEK